jgi:hypothetical protein
MTFTIRGILTILGFLVVALGVAGLVMGGAGAFSRSSGAEDAGSSATPDLAPKAAIPPLDASVAGRTETATFALG